MTADDIPTFGASPLPAEPIPFKLAYETTDDGRQEEEFTARGRVPYAWVMEFWNAEALNVPGQAGALLTFLRRVMTDEDRDRFFERINDPNISAEKETLQQLATYLLLRYEQVDPTHARSGGRKQSRAGQSPTGSGSRASRSSTATRTSKASTRRQARQ